MTNLLGEDSTIQDQNSVVDLVGVQGSANRPVGLETQGVGTGMNPLQPAPLHQALVGEIEGDLGEQVTLLEDQVAPPLVGVEEDLEKKAVGEAVINVEKRAILPEIAPRVVVLQEVVEAVTSVEKRAILLEIAPREVQMVAEEGGHVINVEKRATLPEIVPVVVVPGGEAVISVEKRVILPGTVHPVVIEVQGSVEVVDRLVDLAAEGLVVDLVAGLSDPREDSQVVSIRTLPTMQLMMTGVDFLWIPNPKVQDLVPGLAVVVEVASKEESQVVDLEEGVGEDLVVMEEEGEDLEELVQQVQKMTGEMVALPHKLLLSQPQGGVLHLEIQTTTVNGAMSRATPTYMLGCHQTSLLKCM